MPSHRDLTSNSTPCPPQAQPSLLPSLLLALHTDGAEEKLLTAHGLRLVGVGPATVVAGVGLEPAALVVGGDAPAAATLRDAGRVGAELANAVDVAARAFEEVDGPGAGAEGEDGQGQDGKDAGGGEMHG